VTDSTRPPLPRALVLGLPTAVLLHNAEEALTFVGYRARARATAPIALRPLVPEPEELYVALLVVAAIPVGLALAASRREPARWATTGLLLVAAVMLLNVVWHLAAAAALGGYAPGVVTAVGVNLPVTAAALSWARRSGWLPGRALPLLFVAAALIHGPVLIGLSVIASSFG
jgi:hypothetical protein